MYVLCIGIWFSYVPSYGGSRGGGGGLGVLGCHAWNPLSVQVLCTALANYLLYKTTAIMMRCFGICMLRSMIYEPNSQTEEELVEGTKL